MSTMRSSRQHQLLRCHAGSIAHPRFKWAAASDGVEHIRAVPTPYRTDVRAAMCQTGRSTAIDVSDPDIAVADPRDPGGVRRDGEIVESRQVAGHGRGSGWDPCQ